MLNVVAISIYVDRSIFESEMCANVFETSSENLIWSIYIWPLNIFLIQIWLLNIDFHIFDHWTLIFIHVTIELCTNRFFSKTTTWPFFCGASVWWSGRKEKEYISQNTFMFIRQNEVFIETDTFVTLYIRARGLGDIETPLSLYSLIRNHNPLIRNEFWSGVGCMGGFEKPAGWTDERGHCPFIPNYPYLLIWLKIKTPLRIPGKDTVRFL